jgi:hypothetical protein
MPPERRRSEVVEGDVTPVQRSETAQNDAAAPVQLQVQPSEGADGSVVVLEGDEFDVGSRYTELSIIGRGAFGLVCSAIDVATGEKVAIKKLSNLFNHPVECQRATREVAILAHFRRFQHRNIAHVRDIIKVSNLTAVT